MITCKSCGASMADDLDWCSRCFTRLERPTPVAIGKDKVLTLPDTGRPRFFSGSPTAFGIIGKIAMTGILIGLGIAGFIAFRNWTDVIGRPGWAFGMFLLTGYSMLALVATWNLWKPSRPSVTSGSLRRERIIVVDGELEERIEAAQESLRGGAPSA